MEKNEILKAAQAEPKRIGEYEKEITRKGVAYASMAGVILCLAMVAIELLVIKKLDFGKPAIIILLSSVINLYEGLKMNNRKLIISGGIEAVLFIVCTILYIGVFVA